MDAMQTLELIEKSAASAGVDARGLREQAEALYDEVVAYIAKRDECDACTAHAKAAIDPIARKAYATVVEMQEREQEARDGAHMLGAYLG